MPELFLMYFSTIFSMGL